MAARPTRVLYVENGTTGGGSFQGLVQMVEGLDRRRFTALVVLVNPSPHLARLEAAARVWVVFDPVYSVRSPRVIRSLLSRLVALCARFAPRLAPWAEGMVHLPVLLRLRRLIQLYGVDLVHLNDHPVRDFYAVLAAAGRTRVVSHIRSVRIGVPLTGYAGRLAAAVTVFVANSAFTARAWRRAGLGGGPLEILPNAVKVDHPVRPRDLRAELNLAADHVLGCVANFSPAKGVDVLLQALAFLARAGLSFECLIAGDGPLRGRLDGLADRLGLAGQVSFLGFDPRPLDLIAGLDLLVVPSRSESFGRVLLEAMLVGTPVLATEAGGIPEVVGDSAVLAQVDDPGDLARRIVDVLLDEGLRRRLSRAGRERVQARFALAPALARLTSLYGRVLEWRTIPDQAIESNAAGIKAAAAESDS
jgi:glycosyltransferase involved in cell wall biosynthesis